MILLYVSHITVCDAVCFTAHFHKYCTLCLNKACAINPCLYVVAHSSETTKRKQQQRPPSQSSRLLKKGLNLITMKITEASLRTHCDVQKQKQEKQQQQSPQAFSCGKEHKPTESKANYEGKRCMFSVYLACLTRAVKSRHSG